MICSCGSKETVSVEQEFKNGTVHLRINCAACNTYLRYDPSVKDEDFKMPFGKYKGKKISEMCALDRAYSEWLSRATKDNISKRVLRELQKKSAQLDNQP